MDYSKQRITVDQEYRSQVGGGGFHASSCLHAQRQPPLRPLDPVMLVCAALQFVLQLARLALSHKP